MHLIRERQNFAQGLQVLGCCEGSEEHRRTIGEISRNPGSKFIIEKKMPDFLTYFWPAFLAGFFWRCCWIVWEVVLKVLGNFVARFLEGTDMCVSYMHVYIYNVCVETYIFVLFVLFSDFSRCMLLFLHTYLISWCMLHCCSDLSRFYLHYVGDFLLSCSSCRHVWVPV